MKRVISNLAIVSLVLGSMSGLAFGQDGAASKPVPAAPEAPAAPKTMKALYEEAMDTLEAREAGSEQSILNAIQAIRDTEKAKGNKRLKDDEVMNMTRTVVVRSQDKLRSPVVKDHEKESCGLGLKAVIELENWVYGEQVRLAEQGIKDIDALGVYLANFKALRNARNKDGSEQFSYIQALKEAFVKAREQNDAAIKKAIDAKTVVKPGKPGKTHHEKLEDVFKDPEDKSKKAEDIDPRAPKSGDENAPEGKNISYGSGSLY